MRSWVGLEHMFYCSPEMFRGAADLAEEFDTGIHTHSSETVWEVQESLRQFGRRPIEEFYNRGILGEQTVVAHCVWLDDREVELMARTGTAATHCPCSNMKLASGPARIGHYRSSGMTVGLGTDGEKENNNLDMLGEMKFASLLAKVSTLDPTSRGPSSRRCSSSWPDATAWIWRSRTRPPCGPPTPSPICSRFWTSTTRARPCCRPSRTSTT